MASVTRAPAPTSKRPRGAISPEPDPTTPAAHVGTTKRQKTAAATTTTATATATTTPAVPSALLPADFFETTSSAPAPGEKAAPSAPPDFEAEWAAFQAEVVATPPPSPPLRPIAVNIKAVTTITAAPVRAGEEAPAAAPDDTRVDETVQDEKDEAQQKLLDEFEEMESLGQRVQRVKERREALKVKKDGLMELDDRGALKPSAKNEAVADEDEDEDEDDDEDDFFLRQ